MEFWYALGFSVVFNMTMFLIAFRQRTDKLTDISYAATFVGLVVYSMVTAKELTVQKWLLAFMVGITASVVTGLFLWLKRNEDYVYDAEKQSPNWARDAFIIGVFSVGTALIPIIFGERAADIPSRFTLPAAMGGVLMLAGVLFSAVSSKTWRNAIFLTLIMRVSKLRLSIRKLNG